MMKKPILTKATLKKIWTKKRSTMTKSLILAKTLKGKILTKLTLRKRILMKETLTKATLRKKILTKKRSKMRMTQKN